MTHGLTPLEIITCPRCQRGEPCSEREVDSGLRISYSDSSDRFDDEREPDTTRTDGCPCYFGGPCGMRRHHEPPEDRDEYEDEARALEFEQTRGDVTRRDP
jgi:hypothetical protein